MTPIKILRDYILKAKEQYGERLIAVSISPNFQYDIKRTVKEDIIGATINEIEIRITSFQVKRIENIFKPKLEQKIQQKPVVEKYSFGFKPHLKSKDQISKGPTGVFIPKAKQKIKIR